MHKLQLKIVSPEKEQLNVSADSISVPTKLGQITILPGHEPLVAIVSPGELNVKHDGKETSMHVAGGFLSVEEGSQVKLLADAAEHTEELDVARAEMAKKRAEETLSKTDLSEQEYATATAALERSLSRIRVARKHHSKILKIDATN